MANVLSIYKGLRDISEREPAVHVINPLLMVKDKA